MAGLPGFRNLLTLFLINLVAADRIKDMIYMPLDGASACFRRHNGTHQFGCSSSRSGSIGVIHILEDESDIDWLEQKATAGPYMVVMSFSMFTRHNLTRLKDTSNVNGILLARNITVEYPDFYSPEDTCPNRYSGYTSCDDSKPWNPLGSALLMEDWPFPMFYMENQTQLEAIKKCFWKHNAHDLETQSDRSLCALEMKSFMFAAINSESCMKRSEKLNFNPTLFCDPLGDRNIHWALAPLNEEKNSVIMIISRLDASSLFDGLTPGAETAVTGFVTLLATAYHLNSLTPTVDKTNVIFSLLNGEAFDYIGSSRLVYDLADGNFNAVGGVNLKLDDVVSVIELGQLDSSEVFVHTKNEEGNELIDQLVSGLNAKILRDSVPPSSVQRFLVERSNMSVAVISNHAREFRNKYYNSILDDARNLNFNRNETGGLATRLAKVAVSLAEILYQNVTGTSPSSPANMTSIEELVTELLSCYVDSAKCDLFRAASPPGAKLIDQVLPLYVGVLRVPNTATTLTGQVLALLTGEKLTEMNESTCYEKHLPWMGGYNFTGLCINTTVNYSAAVSPAFTIDGYNMQSGNFSTWTESIWQTLSVRMFLKPSAATERLSMIIGSLVAGTSFVLVWFINSRADIIFDTRRAVDC